MKATTSSGRSRPLRKVVDWYTDECTGRMIEKLECGHEQPRREDIYGATNAYRRRCRKCAAQAQPSCQ